MITKTEAIVLRSIDYRDQSKILSLYTKAYGRMSVIAKGARSSQNKFASAFEIGSHISVVLYKKTTRDIQNISDASLKTSFFQLTTSLDKLSVMHQILELTRLCTEDDEPNIKIFNLLLETFQRLDRFKRNSLNLFFFFQVRLISLLGFKPSFSNCVISGKNIWRTMEMSGENELVLISNLGGVAIKKESIQQGVSGRKISLQAYRLIDLLSSSEPDDLESLSIQPNIVGELSYIIDTYFHYHVDDLPDLRSRSIFSQMDLG